MILVAAVALSNGCAWRQDDRCYLSMNRYRELRDVFIETNSMQRVEQIMERRQWAECERRQFRYLLEKDLYLDDPPAAAGS